MDDIIKLNVGGSYFVTTRGTLCAEADSMLANKFSEDSPFAPPITDDDGIVFLDRNPAYFKYVLEYLRLGSRGLPGAPENRASLECIEAEADYFGLQGLVKICQSKIAAAENQKKEAEKGSKYKIVTSSHSVPSQYAAREILKAEFRRWANQGCRVKDWSCHTIYEPNAETVLSVTIFLEGDK